MWWNRIVTFVGQRFGWDPDHERPRAVALIVATVLVVVGAAFALPAWRTLRAWRVDRLVASAEELIVQGDWQEASRKASAALMLESSNPKALRTAARAQALGNQPVALPLWKMYFSTGRATPEERRQFVPIALRFGALEVARTELLRLLPGHWSDAELLFYGAQIAAGVRDFEESLRYADLAEQFGPTNLQYRLFGATLRSYLPNVTERQRARTSLWELASVPNSVGLQAIDILARNFKLNAGDQAHLLQELQKRPLPGPGERLLELGLMLGAAPAARHPDILEKARLSWGSANATNQAALAGWLNGRRLYEWTLRVVSAEQAMAEARLFTLHLDAMAGLNRWSQVAERLELPKNPLTKVVAEAYRARAATAMKDPSLAAVHWRRAVQAAGDEPNELAFVGGYASAAGEWEPAGLAYRHLVEVAPESWEARSALSSFLQRHGTTVELRDCIRAMSTQWPEHSALRNDLAYLNLLLGVELEEGLQAAREQVGKSPGSLPCRATLALAHLRRQEAAAALGAFSGLDLDWQLALPGHRAIYAAALSAAGRAGEARQHAQQIDRATLRPEEQALLRGL